MQHDPYLPPQAAIVARAPAGDGEGCWRSGRDLYVRRGAVLPPRCITCNAPALTPARLRSVYWHNAWLYVLLLVNILLYAIVAAIVRKSIRVQPGFCAVHTGRRRRLAALGWGLLLGAFALFWMATTPTTVAGILALLGALAVWIRLSNPLRARHIDESRAQLRGCGEPFLASLPGRK